MHIHTWSFRINAYCMLGPSSKNKGFENEWRYVLLVKSTALLYYDTRLLQFDIKINRIDNDGLIN